jgi:hypothetical protein
LCISHRVILVHLHSDSCYTRPRRCFAYPRSYFGSTPSLAHLSDGTSYWLDGPGIEFRWGGGEIFCTRPDWPRTPSHLYNGCRVSFPGLKRQGRGSVYILPSCAEVKVILKLYLYSRPGPSWPFIGCCTSALHINDTLPR